jgi:hypothetical protein
MLIANYSLEHESAFFLPIVVVLRADSPGKAAQWFAVSIPES